MFIYNLNWTQQIYYSKQNLGKTAATNGALV